MHKKKKQEPHIKCSIQTEFDSTKMLSPKPRENKTHYVNTVWPLWRSGKINTTCYSDQHTSVRGEHYPVRNVCVDLHVHANAFIRHTRSKLKEPILKFT